jgi:hypothetical protein
VIGAAETRHFFLLFVKLDRLFGCIGEKLSGGRSARL